MMHPRPSERQFFIFFPCHERRFTCVKVHLAKRLRSVELYILHPCLSGEYPCAVKGIVARSFSAIRANANV